VKRTALAVLATCFTLNMFGRGLGDTYAVFLLPLEREFGWTRSELTSVYSIYLLVHGCTAPLVGLVFDRFGNYDFAWGALIVIGATAFTLQWLMDERPPKAPSAGGLRPQLSPT